MVSIKFDNVYINDFESIVGKEEIKGNLTNIKNVIKDFYNGEKTFETSQISMESLVIDNLFKKNNYINQDVDLIIGGDLSNQLSGTNYAASKFNNSFLGIYSACSSFIEGLIVSSNMLSIENIKRVINITGSHNLASERAFRYPVEYGVLRNVNSTFTITGAVGCILSHKKSYLKITDATIGSPISLGIKDTNMIGAIMAPAAAETIINHLNNFNRKIDYYDLILTGDLGNVGLNILKDYLYEEFNIKTNNIIDAGSNIYKELSEVNDGASGPSVLPLYFFYNVLNKKKYRKILLVGTGSLHSKTLVNQKLDVPAISHAVSVEVKRWALFIHF